MKQIRVCVIGGGASGLIASIFAAKEGAAVTLLEKNEKPAKKLLMTGNGRCNFTNEYQKLDIYKRIAAIESEEEMDDMIEELIDRFGDIPKKVELLLEVARLKNLAHQAYVTEVTQKGVTYTFRMYEKAKIHVERIPDLLKQFPEDLSFKADISDPKFIYQRKKKTKRGEVENPIEVVKKVLIGIKGLLD